MNLYISYRVIKKKIANTSINNLRNKENILGDMRHIVLKGNFFRRGTVGSLKDELT